MLLRLFLLFLITEYIEFVFLSFIHTKLTSFQGSFFAYFTTFFAFFFTTKTGLNVIKNKAIPTTIEYLSKRTKVDRCPPHSGTIGGYFLGGSLLLIPGFLTDFLGFVLLIPEIQNMLRPLFNRFDFSFYHKRATQSPYFNVFSSPYSHRPSRDPNNKHTDSKRGFPTDDNVIDIEAEETNAP